MALHGRAERIGECPLLAVKRTLLRLAVMSAFDAVDGAHYAESECHSVVALKREPFKEAISRLMWAWTIGAEVFKELAMA
jgi:hypothetical protein